MAAGAVATAEAAAVTAAGATTNLPCPTHPQARPDDVGPRSLRRGGPMSAAFDDLARACRATPPVAGFVLGSGMGAVSGRVSPRLRVPFAAVPGLPAATVAGHRGCFTLGDWAGR